MRDQSPGANQPVLDSDPVTPPEVTLAPGPREAEKSLTIAYDTLADNKAAGPIAHAPARRIWSTRGLWLGPLAFVCSLVCTLLLAQPEPVRTGAWLGLIIGGVLAAIAWGGTAWLAPFARQASWWPLEKVTLERGSRLFGIIYSLVLIWWANTQFRSHTSEAFSLAGWLWIASMVLLVASTAGWPMDGQSWTLPSWRNSRGRKNAPAAPGAPVAPVDAVAPTTVALPAFVPATLPVRKVKGRQAGGGQFGLTDRQPPWSRWEIGTFLAIAVMAILLRVWDLTDVPFAIHPDEIITGRTAIQSFNVPGNATVFQTLWFGIDLPALWFFVVAQFLKVGGSTLFVLRLPTAIFGAAAVVPFYFLLRGVWGRATAIAGASLMAFGVASVHFSRVTVNNGVTPVFWAACFLFLLRAVRRGRPLDWVLAGLLGGLSEHFYYGTRLLPVVLVVFGAYLLVVHWRRARHYVLSFPLVAAGYIAAMGPLLTWFMLNPLLYFGQKPGARPLTWNLIPTSVEDLQNMWNTLWPLFSRNLLTFNTLPASDAFYFAPMLRLAEAAMLPLGVALLIWRWRHPASFLLLVSGLGVLIAGGTLVPDAGNVNHWTPAFPAIYAAIAVPVSGLALACGRFLSRRMRLVAVGAFGIGLVLLGWLNMSYYFTQYGSFRADMDIPAAKARFQAQLGNTYRVRSVGQTWQLYDPETTSYLVKAMDGGQIWNPSVELPLPGAPGKGLAFTFFADQIQYLQPLESMYPGGTHGQMNGQNGVLIFDYYTLPAGLANANYGAVVQLFNPGKTLPWEITRADKVGDMPAGVLYPVRARWSALLYVGSMAPVQLSVPGGTPGILFDGQDGALSRSGRPVQPGWHQVVVDATLTGPQQLKLMMSQGGADPVEVPHELLWALPPGSGLLGSVAAADPSQGPVVRNEQYIGFTGLNNGQAFGPQIGTASPLRVRWAGELQVTVSGQYQFEVRTNGVSRLSLAGNTVVRTCRNSDPASAAATLQLNSGWHPVQLDFQAAGGAGTLELYWTTPDGVRSLIPPGAFRFTPDTASGPTTPPALPAQVDCQTP